MKNILFIQDTLPCVRTLKIATVLSEKGLNINLLHSGKLDSIKKVNEIFKSATKLKSLKRNKIKQIKRFIKENSIDLIHYHNEPDILCSQIIEAKVSVPIIYDQHDFLSPKRNMREKDLIAEKICNEKADGKIYITENYKNLVNKRYDLGNENFILPNLLLSKTIPAQLREKLSKKDGKIHLVFIGLITQHENEIRNLIHHFQILSQKGFIIHVYPTRSKKYPIYESISNIVMHSQLPIDELLEELTHYDFGILFLNMENVTKEKKEELRYGAWNKFYDYLSAGIPSITLSSYHYMEKLIREHYLGMVFQSVEDINIESLSKFDRKKYEYLLDENRKKFSMESIGNEIIQFYKRVVKKI